jgi:hypothetical protein
MLRKTLFFLVFLFSCSAGATFVSAAEFIPDAAKYDHAIDALELRRLIAIESREIEAQEAVRSGLLQKRGTPDWNTAYERIAAWQQAELDAGQRHLELLRSSLREQEAQARFAIAQGKAADKRRDRILAAAWYRLALRLDPEVWNK